MSNKHTAILLLLLLLILPACDATTSKGDSNATPSPTAKIQTTAKVQITATSMSTQKKPSKVFLGDELAAFIALYGHSKYQDGTYDFGTVQGPIYLEELAVDTVSESDLRVSSITFIINSSVDLHICTIYNPPDSTLVEHDSLGSTYSSKMLKKELPASAWVGTGNGVTPGTDNPPGDFAEAAYIQQGKTICDLAT